MYTVLIVCIHLRPLVNVDDVFQCERMDVK